MRIIGFAIVGLIVLFVLAALFLGKCSRCGSWKTFRFPHLAFGEPDELPRYSSQKCFSCKHVLEERIE